MSETVTTKVAIDPMVQVVENAATKVCWSAVSMARSIARGGPRPRIKQTNDRNSPKNYCIRFTAAVTYNQMVVYELSETEIDRIFQAMADATRRDIIKQAMRREQSVSELAKRYDMSFAAVQKHVAVLERATLITKERRGREQIVHGNPESLRRATRLLEAYEGIWRQRVGRIGDLLSEELKGVKP
jgi:DNA-binding transcriptional ArsR family regulator